MPPQATISSSGAMIPPADPGHRPASPADKKHQQLQQKGGQEEEVLVDDKGRPYNLGPTGFVRDLNTRAVKIARRVAQQSQERAAAAAAAAAPSSTTTCSGVVMKSTNTAADSAALAAATAVAADKSTSGTVRSSVAQEIQFVLGGRLPFVKRIETLVLGYVCMSVFFLIRYGILECGVAPTVGAFAVMYFVLDFYSGVLHVVLDDDWNMKVPLLSQPAMEFQYHHHIPDDGCSRPFVEGMGDLNFIVGLHLALFTALFVRGGSQDFMLLTAGGWKMVLAYWGIWNHRQAHQLKSKRPRWCTYLQNNGIMLSPAAHKVHHTPPHDDEYCLLGVTTWPVTWLGRRNLGSIFWIALFLGLTALDTVCASRLLSMVFAR
ncbi:unnamed protein product [Ectocarpus sp. 4 AP-2014]